MKDNEDGVGEWRNEEEKEEMRKREEDEEGGGWKDRGRIGIRRENGVDRECTGGIGQEKEEGGREGVGRRKNVVEVRR